MAAPAALPRRLASLVYEALIAAAIVLIAGFALTPVMSPVADPGGSLVLPGFARRATGFVLVVAILGGYFAYFWSGGRRTLPMKTWKLALVDANGGPLSVGRAIVRYVAAWSGPAGAIAWYAATHSRAAALALALPYAWALVDRERAFLHDRVARTQLVSTG